MKKILFLAVVMAFAVGFGSGVAEAQTDTNQWQGLYAGVNIGAVKNHDTGLNTCTNPSGVVYGAGCFAPAYGITNATGGVAGVQLGYNWQFGRWVIGPELDYDASTVSGHLINSGPIPCINPVPPAPGTFNSSESLGSIGTARLRVGVTLSEKALFFVSGGYALANANLTTRYTFPIGGVAYNASVNTQRSGFAESVGGEWKINPRTSIKLELLSYYLRAIGVNAPEAPGGGYFAGKNFEFHGSAIRAGVNIKI